MRRSQQNLLSISDQSHRSGDPTSCNQTRHLGRHPRLVVVRTLSKAHALAGLRGAERDYLGGLDAALGGR